MIRLVILFFLALGVVATLTLGVRLREWKDLAIWGGFVAIALAVFFYKRAHPRRG